MATLVVSSETDMPKTHGIIQLTTLEQEAAEFAKADELVKGLWAQKPLLEQDWIDEIYEQLVGVVAILDKAGVRYHLIAGSMLGLARHGGLIPWDDDVDIGIHANDVDKVWQIRDQFKEYGWTLARCNIGFKFGPGEIVNHEAMELIDGIPSFKFAGGLNPDQQFGSATPFDAKFAHTDIFAFKEDGEVDGVPVMRYASKEARERWPREVVSAAGWYADAPTKLFGGYVEVRSLPPREMDWALKIGFGPQWATHDGSGKEIVDFSFAAHSSLLVNKSAAKSAKLA